METPNWMWALKSILFGTMLIDILSHWTQTIAAAASEEHHKKIKNRYALLDFYYRCRPFIGVLCVATEVFLLQVIFLFKEENYGTGFWILFFISGGLHFLKFYIHVLQLCSATLKIVKKDEDKRKN